MNVLIFSRFEPETCIFEDFENRDDFDHESFITRDALRAARVENSVEYLRRRRRRCIFLHRSHKW